jgi:TRAP-type C4-dicarboxylate transport system permease small subunit
MAAEPRRAGRIDQLLGTISASAAWVGSLFTLIIMISITADVARRAFENRAIPGVVEYTELLLVGLVYLGLGHAQRLNRHIEVDVVMRRVRPRLALWLRVAGYVLLVFIASLILFATSVRALESFESHEIRMGLLRVSIWPGRLLVAAGIGLFLAETVRNLTLVVRGHRHPDETPATRTV